MAAKHRRKKGTLYVILVATAVVLFWRGVWGLLDVLLLPNNELLSYTVSLVISIVILVTTHKLVDELL